MRYVAGYDTAKRLDLLVQVGDALVALKIGR